MSPHVIAVLGAGQAAEPVRAQARAVGRLLAEHGCTVVTGGLGGVMEAASEGARSAGGRTLGILPGPHPSDANPHVELAVATGMGDARNAVIANTAAGFIAVAGSWGTLSEIAFVLKRGKPIVSLGSFAAPLPVIEADTPEVAVALLLESLAR